MVRSRSAALPLLFPIKLSTVKSPTAAAPSAPVNMDTLTQSINVAHVFSASSAGRHRLAATAGHQVPSSFLAIGVALLWDALERPLFEPLLLAFSVSFGLPVENVALTIFFEQCASVENLVGVDSVERALPPWMAL